MAANLKPYGKIVWRILAGCLMLALTAAACVFFPAPVDRSATSTAEAIFVSGRLEQTLDVHRTATAVAATEIARQVTATAMAAEELTATADALATRAASATAAAEFAATAQARVTGTAQASGMAQKVEQYVKAGYLPISEGTYYQLEDYEGNLASKSGLIVHRTGHSPKVFAIRANITYQLAANSGNWYITGCGFAFWDNGQSDYYSIQSAMDGFLYSRAYVGGRQYNLHKFFFGTLPRPTGTYQATLIVNPKESYLLIGDRLTDKITVLENSKTEGSLSYLIASGIDRDFGARCTFSDVELWVVE